MSALLTRGWTMKLQELRYITAVAKYDLNVLATAKVLFTYLPGISKQIRLLEDELVVEIFARPGKNLTHVIPAWEKILALAEQILQKTVTIKRLAQEFQDQTKG